MDIKFSVKTKIFGGIIIPSVLLLLVIYLNYTYLNALGRSAELILSKNYRSIKAAQQIIQHLETDQNRILSSLLLDRHIDRQKETFGEEILRLLTICRNNITEPGEEQVIASLFKEFEKYNFVINKLISSHHEKTKPAELYQDFISLTAALNTDLNTLVLINEKAMEAADRETKNVARNALRYSMGLLISAILFTAIYGYIISSKISSPLIMLAKSLAGVKEGSGHYPQFLVPTRDEIGFLTREFNRLFERLKVYDRVSMDKLMAEKQKVLHAEEAKARFIADLSHQLKNPMTSLSMGIGILLEKTKGLVVEKYRQLLETAKEDCDRLSALINELVNIARLDAMVKPRTREVLHLEEVMNECLKPLLYHAQEKGIHIETEFEPALPPVAIDSLRFPWVITNLVGNAIRYTDRGGRVFLKVGRQGNRCCFQCSDTGIGMDEKYIPRIFDRFTQFSERERMGTIGLGLAIVKEIIDEHGGDIKVTSKVGEGTTFTFWIPLGTEDAQ